MLSELLCFGSNGFDKKIILRYEVIWQSFEIPVYIFLSFEVTGPCTFKPCKSVLCLLSLCVMILSSVFKRVKFPHGHISTLNDPKNHNMIMWCTLYSAFQSSPKSFADFAIILFSWPIQFFQLFMYNTLNMSSTNILHYIMHFSILLVSDLKADGFWFLSHVSVWVIITNNGERPRDFDFCIFCSS